MKRARLDRLSDQLCECGCGQFTSIGTKSGKPNQYVYNHHSAGKERPRRPTVERFLERIGGETDTGCWPWTGSVDTHGYGHFAVNGRTTRAHRFSYEHFVGPIPEGLTLDHLCRNRPCVNPAHLEPVTNAENVRRGNATSAINARKTHCIHGHPFDEENTYIAPGNGMRTCRTCKREDNRRRKAEARAKAAA
jgi:hypothetical protein